ncbi:heavy metal translocating P-type ATPase [Pectinatus sottacetonis]|uniref:heavy metal translocating P-type ATPase n=1 Tax=Pectinatus sottacetonis TaxID=1002795 RepID=UPI0018C7C074|nr:HAD-IC family P-type ATPase [Pectinatus sottacetonis]
MLQQNFYIANIENQTDINNIESIINNIPGIDAASIDIHTKELKILLSHYVDKNIVIYAADQAGYKLTFLSAKKFNTIRQMVAAALMSIICFIVLLAINSVTTLRSSPFFIADYLHNPQIFTISNFSLVILLLLINYRYYMISVNAMAAKKIHRYLLLSLSTFALLILAIYDTFSHNTFLPADSLYLESIALLLTFSTIMELYTAYAKKIFWQLNPASIDKLPDFVNILDPISGEKTKIPIEEISSATTLLIGPNDTLPADGKIIAGNASINESILTGKKTPVKKGIDDRVYAFTVNTSGTFQYQADNTGSATLALQLCTFAHNAQFSALSTADSSHKLSHIMLIIALLAAIIMSIYWAVTGKPLSFIITVFSTILITAYPYGIDLSAKLPAMSAIKRCFRAGVFLKDSSVFEQSYHLDTLIFAKTGILTKGQPRVTGLYPEGLSPKVLLSLAASAEASLNHLLSRSILASAAKNRVQLQRISSAQLIRGKGVEALINREIIRVGKLSWLKDEGVEVSNELQAKALQAANEGNTPLFIALDKYCHGVIVINDPLNHNIKDVLHALKNTAVIIFTGDNRLTTKNLAAKAGINQIRCELSAADKAKEISLLHTHGLTISMISNDMNDDAALTAADIGIAFDNYAISSIKAANVIIFADNLPLISDTINFSRKIIHQTKQNIILAAICNLFCILTAAGLFYPWSQQLLNPLVAVLTIMPVPIFITTRALYVHFHHKQV